MPFKRITPLKVAVGLFIVALAVLAPLFSVFNLQAGNRKFHKADTNKVDPNDPGDFRGILVWANITGMNPQTLPIHVCFKDRRGSGRGVLISVTGVPQIPY